MAAEENSINVKITGDANGVKTEMDRAASAVKNSTSQMQSEFSKLSSTQFSGLQNAFAGIKGSIDELKSGFSGITSTISGVTGAFAGIAAIVAGGKLFGAAIEETVRLNAELRSLQTTLGINRDKAEEINTSLHLVGGSSETYTSAAFKLSRQLKVNESDLNALGLATRDAYGNLKNMNVLMEDALKILGQYKEGTDRNEASIYLFGRGAAEIAPLMRLNSEVMARASGDIEKFHLSMDPAVVGRYNVSVRESKLVLEGLKNQISMAVMPILADMADWITGNGAPVIEFFGGVVRGLAATFELIQIPIQGAWNILKGFADYFMAVGFGIGAIFDKIIHGDVAGALVAGQVAMTKMNGIVTGTVQTMANDAGRSLEKIWGNLSGQVSGTKPGLDLSTPPGSRHFVAPEKDEKEGKEFDPLEQARKSMQIWDMELSAKKAANEKMASEDGRYYEMSKANEAAHWGQILELQSLTSQERALVEQKYYSLTNAARKEATAQEIADLKDRLEEARQNGNQRLEIERQIVAKITAVYGVGSREYSAAKREEIRVAREVADEKRKIEEQVIEAKRNADLEGLEEARRQGEWLVQIGQMTEQQLVVQEQQLEDRKYQIQLSALEQQRALYNKETLEYARMTKEIESLERGHNARMLDLQHKYIQSSKAYEIFTGMRSSFQSSINSMLTTARSFQEGFTGILTGIYQVFASLLAKMITQWLMHQLLKLSIFRAFQAQEIATQAASRVAGSTMATTAAAGQVVQSAGVAGAGAFASQAGIPIVGPALGAAAMAAAIAACMGMQGMVASGGAMMSAAGGYDIPSGINPIVQTHAREMILPHHLADRVRKMTDGGSASFTINTLDSRSLKRFVQDNGKLFAKAAKRQVRLAAI